jgi:hypothetical protein
MKRLLTIGVILMALLPATAFARGGVVVRPGFGPGGYGWYGPYYGMYPYGPYGAPNVGQLKLDTKVKDAEVYINGSYAGTVGKLKTMWMRPGSYDISIQAPGRTSFKQQVYVIAGKTLKLEPDLRVQATPAPTDR